MRHVRFDLLTLMTLATTTLSPACGTPPAKTYQVEGAAIEVSLLPEKQEPMVGEPIYLLFKVNNRSTHDLLTVQGGDYRNSLGRPESYQLTVADQAGKLLAMLDAVMQMGGISYAQKIPAGGKWERKLWLHQWVKLSDPGEYVITCRTKLKIGLEKGNDWHELDRAAGTPVEVETRIRMLPNDTKKMVLMPLMRRRCG